jgi:hypothetical protein
MLTPIAQGTYNVLVTATDAVGNSLSDTTTNELVIDTTPPVVAVNALITRDSTPQLTGAVGDNLAVASVSVTVGGVTYPAVVAGGTWTSDVTQPLSDGLYDVQVHAWDTAGNEGVDGTVNELLVDTVAPTVTVTPLATPDTTPALHGAVNDPAAAITIVVNGQTRAAVNNADGTWTLPDNSLNPLPQGVYDVQASAADAAGNIGQDATTNELLVDSTPPVVTVGFLTTRDTTPPLHGTVDDPAAVVTLAVNGQTRTAVNSGSGTWTLADNSLNALAQGVYNVQVSATDAAGNVGHDSTTNELTIDLTAPVVTVNTLFTTDTTPELTGTIDDSSATVWVTVGVDHLQAVNLYGENRWVLQDNRLTALAPGVYDVQVTATDSVGNVGYDATTNELHIDMTPPTVTIAPITPSPTGSNGVQFRVTFSEPVAPTFTTMTLLGTLAGAATFGITSSDPVYTVTVAPNDPNADGTVGIRVGAGVTDRAGNPCALQSSSLITIQNLCGFTEQPQGKEAYVGDAHTLAAAMGCVDGLSVSYRWKWDNGTGTVQDGPAATSWALTNLQKTQAGGYWCEVTYGGDVYASAIAAMQVEDHLAITTSPEGGSIPIGESYTFSVVTTGGYAPLHYVWKKYGVMLPGWNDASCTISSVADSDSGAYTVEVTDDHGEMRISEPAMLIVSDGMPAAGLAGLALACCAFAIAGMAVLRKRA